MCSEWRKDKRDPYFTAPKRRYVPPLVRSVDRSLWLSLALIGAALLILRIIVDLW